MTVSKKWLHTKWTTLHFVVRNKQCFPLLLGTKNTFRIFILFSETKSAFISDKNFSTLFPISTFPFVVRNEQRFKNLHGVVGNKECFIAYLQSEILIFLAFVSLGDLTFFFRATWLRFWATWLWARWLSGDLTSSPCPRM